MRGYLGPKNLPEGENESGVVFTNELRTARNADSKLVSLTSARNLSG